MAVFFMAANSAAKRIAGGSKVGVMPESGSENAEESSRESVDGGPRLSLDGVEGFPMPEFNHRLSMCRSRKPTLETIKEEPVRSML
uniref:Uncharacterized protein n=1 Tax=Rhizophora mucronata TaxID=61149 RepID=A0A2P2R4Q7_RHIMU